MKSIELKQKYLDFFKTKSHKIIDSAPLIPENDPSVLFTTAGMHPLVPFLLGQPHPLGKRLADCQKCIRTGDIEEVGDDTHLTFFEMLGNWSLGDYFKKEAIEWSFEFLTKELNFPIKRLAVSCFKGDKNAPKDEFSAKTWNDLGIPKERIAFLSKDDNWWGPAGETGPCGPDTEMFYWTGDEEAPENFDTDDERWVEIWNDVFMEYNKDENGNFIPLENKSVDTGMGLERVLMIIQEKKNVYETSSIAPILNKIKSLAKIELPNKEQSKSLKIITDHIRAATFILGDERGVAPSNVDQGYVLRKLIRRSIRHLRLLNINITTETITPKIAETVIKEFKNDYQIIEKKQEFILEELKKEEERFKLTLEKGLNKFSNIATKGDLTAENTFLLYQSYGFPLEMVEELAEEKGLKVDSKGFKKLYKEHQEKSRAGAEQKFKGGLSDSSDKTTKLHTATHLLNQALREVLGKEDIAQKGSNITQERLRFDFNFERKMTDEEKKAVEELVNKKIQEEIPVKKEKLPLKEAFASGAKGEFGAKYPEEVFVYTIGDFSKEICNGPHAKNTSELGHFKIKKEESSSAGIRRIKAILE